MTVEEKSMLSSDMPAEIRDIKNYESNKFSVEKKKETSSEAAIISTKNKQPTSNHKQIYFLQIGAFRRKSEAENKKANLALIGFEANISKYQANSGLLYRVRIGPFSQIKRIDQVRLRLADNGIDVAVLQIIS